MSGFIKFLSSDKTIWRSLLAAAVILLLSSFLTLLFYHNLPPLVPVFNQLSWGTDRLSAKITLLIPPIIALGLLFTNTLITKYTYEKMPTVTRMLNITTLIVALLTLVFIFRTITLIL